jgi:hypothetical protein
MTAEERRLLHHLTIAVGLKLVVLTLLWWAFVRDDRVNVDAQRAAAQIGVGAVPREASR